MDSLGKTKYDVKLVISLYHEHKHIGIVSEITGIERRTIRRYLDNNGIERYKKTIRKELRKNLGNARRGKKQTEKWREWRSKMRGENHPGYKGKITCFCHWCGKELQRYESQIQKVKHLNCGSKACKTAQRQFYSGSRSPHWKGGKTQKMLLIRHSLQYKTMVKEVLTRDNYTCTSCGQIGGELEVHHIKEISNYPGLIFDVNNCITLCKNCHKLTDNYLHKAKRSRKKC